MAGALRTGLRWTAPFAAAAVGVALRDCFFLSASGPLALGVFYAGMDERPADDGLRAGSRCVLAGLASLAAGAALVAAVLAATYGAWTPQHDRFYAGAWLLAAAVAAYLALLRDDRPPMDDAPRPRVALLAALPAAMAALAIGAGLAWSPCGLSVATASLLALAGWRLLADVAPALLFAASRR